MNNQKKVDSTEAAENFQKKNKIIDDYINQLLIKKDIFENGNENKKEIKKKVIQHEMMIVIKL